MGSNNSEQKLERCDRTDMAKGQNKKKEVKKPKKAQA
jgi:hypothetical protein